MRSILIIFIFFGSISTACEALPASDFSLKAHVVEALEGGPVIIKITLIYQGKQTITIRAFASQPTHHIEAGIPDDWHLRSVIFGSPSDLVGGNRTIQPGNEWTETIRLHRFFDTITSGTARVTLSWPICSAQGKHPIIANPKIVLNLYCRRSRTDFDRSTKFMAIVLVAIGSSWSQWNSW